MNNIPYKNAEHFEAVQEEVSALKAKTRTDMSPEDVARLDVIEECSAKLEAARIPFLLWGSVDPEGLTEFGPRGFWQFNRLAYPKDGEDKYEAIVTRGNEAGQVIFKTEIRHLSKVFQVGPIALYGRDKTIMLAFQNGEQIYPTFVEPKKKDASETS